MEAAAGAGPAASAQCSVMTLQQEEASEGKRQQEQDDLRTLCRETKNDNQHHSKQKKNKKFREHQYTPRYWKNERNGVYQ
eukprot:4036087-Amphidinium_carterae.1